MVIMKKNSDPYQRLAKHLDDLPGGFPATKSGVELRILKRLFTPEQAQLAVHLILLPEKPAAIAARAGLHVDETAERLKEMAARGLISRVGPKEGQPRYWAAQFVIGIWEYQVNNLNPELIQDMEEYIPHLFNTKVWKKTPQLRTVPIQQSIPVEHRVMDYENAEKLIRSHKRFLVAPCICRQERGMMDQACDKPLESCLLLGGAVEFYHQNGLGRLVELEEALDLLKVAEKTGLIVSPSNAKKIANICFCCGCCCGVLRTLKEAARPGDVVSSPFVVRYDEEKCTGCLVCIDRCQMDALQQQDDRIKVDLGRCIGCGLCVTTCAQGALQLRRKPDNRQPEVPDTIKQAYIRLAKERKKWHPLHIIGDWLKGKVKRPHQ